MDKNVLIKGSDFSYLCYVNIIIDSVSPNYESSKKRLGTSLKFGWQECLLLWKLINHELVLYYKYFEN